ncbi:fucose permease-like protein [Francisella orientalis]|uniref:Fucose permease-like protein n=1 Tax=Francisella orientalis TaxID=299583 RepID=A0ABM5U5F6_9GAMM|nr:fucose permease-like protein [Francisella orientalis]AFJ43718.1 fucose permease-like protein [Francisella orientalis str. Toba 04]AHB99134.1 hypothetical protein M973_04200 [Francisella orientalis LADL 07-285A]AKN85420.1 Fucose permease-like protein [Francisella orientalis FNO12]AKN86959.1 Fucose permease-like protein [Francisella orientalis FNO24]AKN88497.1 Fucose permease-like protein [Francisella orientalis]
MQIVQKLSSQEYNTNYQSDGAKILRGENVDLNTTRNYFILKDSAYPEIYNSGAYALNMMFSNTGGGKDGATLVVKNLLDKMGCIYPIINFVVILMAILGLSDSCIYPSVLGYAMDKLPHVSSGATSFLVTVGAIGISLGTSLSGMLCNLLGREPAMLVGPVMLLVLATLVVIVHNLKVVK